MRHEREAFDLWDAVLIAGPTASGKSALAIRLVDELGGSIINADSMQVYTDLRILTARPTLEETASAPHDLYGHVDGARNYSVGFWLADAEAALARARQADRLPIFVGGTGLYFKALTLGLSEIPPVPEAVRQRVRARWGSAPPQDLHAHLTTVDPLTAARLRSNDPQRLLRALEVFEASGISLASLQSHRQKPLLDVTQCLCLFVAPERDALAGRIERRFDAMLAAGALAEVEHLASRHLDPALPVMRAHGVPALIAYLRSELPLEAAARQGKLDTRHYSKRQFTFARHQLPDFAWVTPEAAMDHVHSSRCPSGE